METKTCSKCNQEKPIEAFQFRNKAKGTRHSTCTECGRQYRREHFANNKEYYREKTRKRNKKLVSENRAGINDYLESHPCVDCGETDPVVLQFDHVRGEKHMEVSKMLTYSWSAIEEEIDKCEVRCANCHLRRHAKERST